MPDDLSEKRFWIITVLFLICIATVLYGLINGNVAASLCLIILILLAYATSGIGNSKINLVLMIISTILIVFFSISFYVNTDLTWIVNNKAHKDHVVIVPFFDEIKYVFTERHVERLGVTGKTNDGFRVAITVSANYYMGDNLKKIAQELTDVKDPDKYLEKKIKNHVRLVAQQAIKSSKLHDLLSPYFFEYQFAGLELKGKDPDIAILEWREEVRMKNIQLLQ